MADTPSDSKNTFPQETLNDHRALLDQIDQHAGVVLNEETDPLRRSQLLRLFAEEIQCPINEKTANTLLVKAEGKVNGVCSPRLHGQKMDTTPTPWAWEGVLMSGTFNLLVAPPKVGKSALMVGMISAWWHGEKKYLGQTLHGACPKVFIIGTDQPENDWHNLFKREGLVTSDGNLGGPVEMLWHTASPLHLTDEGIEHLEVIAAANPNSLFLLDSYHACCSPLGLEEAASSFDGPARKLAQALAPHKTTLAMIHHTNKSVSGGNATNASRGSNALPAAASLTILMNWFKQPLEGQTQTDQRVVLKTQGRAKGTTLLIELKDDGWVHHGDGESVLHAEAMQEVSDGLQGRQADAYDHILERWVAGSFPVTSNELSAVLSIDRNKVNRCLRALQKKGLICESGQSEPSLEGGRPSIMYVPVIGPTESGGLTPQTSLSSTRVHEEIGKTPLIPLERVSGGGRLNTPAPGTPVERCIKGNWSNGWVVVDASSLHAVKVAQLGNPMLRISNLRWEQDIRPCAGSPFSAEKTNTTDSYDF